MEPIEILRTIPLFQRLNADHLAALAVLAQPEHHYPLAQIVHQGDLGNRFFMIAKGTVTMRRTTGSGAEGTVGILAPHTTEIAKGVKARNFFGEQMFSSQEPYDFQASAVDEVDVFRIHRKDFDALVAKDHTILHALDFIRLAEHKRTHGYSWIAEGEAVEAIAHKHWWALMPGFAAVVVVGAFLLLFNFLLGTFVPPGSREWIYAGVGLVMFFWVVAIVNDWYNDEYVVTNQRIVHIERLFFIQEEVRDTAPIDKIQGVVLEKEGLPGIVLGVGTLIVQTPGREEGNVSFHYVGNAEKIRKAILAQRETNRARQVAESRERFRATVRSELREYIAPQLTVPEPEAPKPVRKTHRREQGWVGAMRFWVREALDLELHEADRTVWRKHWIVLLKQTWLWIVLLIALDVLFYLLARAGASNLSVLWVGGVIFLFIFVRLWWEWEDWRNDTYTVTDTMIIDSERLPFGLREKTSVAPLDQITDIVVDIPGIIATLLKVGTLKIETAGKTGQLVFYSIHEPKQAQDEIYRRIAEFKSRRAKEDDSIRSASVVDALIAYHRLQKDEERTKADPKQAENQPSEAAPAEEQSATTGIASDVTNALTEGGERVWETPDEES